FRKIVNRFQPDIIHSFLYHSNLFARCAHFFNPRLSVISGIRTVYSVKEYGRLYRLMDRLTHSLDSFYVANSQHGLQSVVQSIGLPKEKLVMIHNGLESISPFDSIEAIREDVHFEFGFDKEDCIVGVAAQLRPAKRHDLLIQATARLKDRFPRMRLLLAGQGETEEDLRALAVSKGVEKQVVFAGFRSDVDRLLRGMDIFALPSDVEGQPVSVLEAMYAGLPIVATRVGGLPEVVVAGETGFLCQPGNVEELCRALTRLLDSPELRRQMGDAGLARVQKHFSAERMARRFEGLYSQCG
ncbi:MAG: glycosyltransferase, partial [Candidatus Hinthialibacter sp.]